MTDYDWSIGTGGTMRIRVLTTTVEFWITSNNSTTFAYDMPWGYTVNGVTDNTNEYRYEAGAGWERLGAWTVTTDQTVTFRLYDTGTGALGSGETHSVAVDRTSAPPAPGPWAIEQIFDTSVQGDVDGFGTGGLTIDQVQVRYDESSTAASPLYFDPGTDAYGTITGLARNTTYYFWVRTHNSKGWSPWSARTSAKTHTYPDAPSAPVLSEIKQTSLKSLFANNGYNGGAAFLEHQLGYGLSDVAPTTWVTGYSHTLTGLEAGQKYYFWARSRNVYGWSALSARSEATLYAGAWVDVAGVKKRAVPYVKVAGVWKPAESWAKIAGLWKVSG